MYRENRKPENVLVRADGSAALADFDLCCPARDERTPRHRPVDPTTGEARVVARGR